MRFQLGPWLIQSERNLILRGGVEIHLTPKAMDLLVCLAKRPGEVVSRDDLLREVWDGASVTDDAITRCIGELRRAFDDDPRNPAVLETVSRRGYRIVAGIDWNPDAPHRSRRRWLWPALALLIVLAITALSRLPVFRPTPVIRSLVVLPLDDHSNDRQDYFAEGMTEALITELAQINSLRVISRTSAMRYRASGRSIPDIARELSVDAVVEGSVLRSGSRIRITAQLIHAATDSHLWSGSFERDLGDIVSLQGDIARSIAAELRITLTQGELRRLRHGRPVDPIAYEAFLVGRYFYSRSQFRQAAESFEQATIKDPTYALAHAMLCEADSMIHYAQDQPPGERTLRAMYRARELDDSLAEVHMNLGDKLFYNDWDWAAGEAEFRRAVEIDPSSVDAAAHYTMCLHVQSRWDAALRECRRALHLDPVSPRVNGHWMRLLIDSRKYDEALAAAKNLMALDPSLPGSWRAAARIYQHMGRDEEAVTALLKADALSGVALAVLKEREAAARTGGLRGYWNTTLPSVFEESPPQPFDLAARYLHAGRKEQALQLLESALARRSPRLAWLRAQSTWDPLRSEPRFHAILRRMRLEQ